jgi:trans-aconitate methyltransferase
VPTAVPWDTKFTTNEHQADHFLESVLTLVPQHLGRPASVLDVGCGDGGKVLRLAESWPETRFTGVDIGESNVREAERRQLGHPRREQLRFHAADYLKFAAGRHDVILADSVLHLIPGSTDLLFAKLASELTPGGLLIFSMPSACLYNTVLTRTRQLLRLCRSRVTDGLLLTLARLLHGRSHSREFLRERLHYMYILPERHGSRALETRLAAEHQLAMQGSTPCLHTSLGQPKHRLWCFCYQPTNVPGEVRRIA